MATSSKRVESLDLFRGIAIVLIVAGHCYAGWPRESYLEKTITNLITGGSALFVFLSGYFFHAVFYHNFNYGRFITKKVANVFIPYLVLSTIGFLVVVVYFDKPYHEIMLEGKEWYSHLVLYFKYMITGRVFTAYWYVPFILMMFIISPAFISFIRLNIKAQLTIFILLSILSVFVQRPSGNLNPLHSLIYYFPVYCLGIIFSMNQAMVRKWLNKSFVIFGLLAVVVSLVDVAIRGMDGNYTKKDFFSFNGIDLVYIQKFFLIVFLFGLCEKMKPEKMKTLKFLADYSFAIYFIHPWVLMVLLKKEIFAFINFAPGIATFMIAETLTISISIIIALAIKILLSKKSRFLIGY